MTARLNMMTMASDKSKDQRIAGITLIIMAIMLFAMASTSQAMEVIETKAIGQIIAINANNTLSVRIQDSVYTIYLNTDQIQLQCNLRYYRIGQDVTIVYVLDAVKGQVIDVYTP